MRCQPLLLLGLLCSAATLPALAQPEPAPVAPSVATAQASRAAAPRRASRARPAGERAYVYQGTSHGDNLWDIAGAVAGANAVDRNQVMVAIFRANPQAFPEGNLHRIQLGLDLTIPSLADIRREDRSRAAALVAQHRSAYADRRLKPMAMYALAAGKADAVAAAGPASGPAVLAASAEGGAASISTPDGPADSRGGITGWVVAGVMALLAALGWLLRAWWRRPMALDFLELPAQPEGAPLAGVEPDAADAAAQDEQRAEAVAASLYTEDLASPAVPPLPGEAAQPVALSDADPAAAAHLAKSLAEAFEELDRPQAAKTWRARGDEAAAP